MTDDMIDTSHIPPLTDEFFTTAKWRMPKHAVTVIPEVDPEAVGWYKAQGDNYARYLAAALRIYAQAHQILEKVGFDKLSQRGIRQAQPTGNSTSSANGEFDRLSQRGT